MSDIDDDNEQSKSDDNVIILDEVKKAITSAKLRAISASEKGGKAYAKLLEAIAATGATFTFDEFASRAMMNGEIISDSAIRQLQHKLLIGQVKNVPPTSRLLEMCIGEAERKGFHPVREWLDGLTWDNQPRLETWVSTWLGAAPTNLHHTMGRLFLIAAVRRIRRPGCKFDHVLIFQGATGAGKSTAVRILAKNDRWFSDSFPPFDDERRQIEALQGRWIIEYPELAGMKRADQERIKAFLSRQTDRARPAYGRVPIEMPRQCVFFGTTEEANCLLDLTNRRFWPIATGKIDTHGLKDNRDQLWAEAAANESLGEPCTLPEELWAEATELQASFVNPPAFVDAILDLIGDVEEGVFPCNNLREWLGIPNAAWASCKAEAGKTMKYLGFSRIRAGKDTHGAKRRQWLYVKNPNNKFLHGNELPTIGKI